VKYDTSLVGSSVLLPLGSGLYPRPLPGVAVGGVCEGDCDFLSLYFGVVQERHCVVGCCCCCVLCVTIVFVFLQSDILQGAKPGELILQ